MTVKLKKWHDSNGYEVKMGTGWTYCNNAVNTGVGQATKSGGFLIYSNSPEKVTSTELADDGKWLCREQVSGNGRIATWHTNGSGASFTNAILLYNPNNVAITVSISKLQQTTNYNDAAKSLSYMEGIGTSKTFSNIPAYGYQVLASMSISSGANFGMIMDVTNSSGKSIYIYDLAYTSNSGGATAGAIRQGTKVRGKCSNNTTTIDLGTITYAGSPVGKRLFSNGDTRCLTLTDSSSNPAVSLILNGNYGTVTTFKLKVVNSSGSTKQLRVGFGSAGTGLFYAAKMSYNNQDSAQYGDWIPQEEVRGAIDLGSMTDGASKEFYFDFMVTSMASTPAVFIVGEY